MKKISCLILIGLLVFGLVGCSESRKRELKSMQSEFNGGLNRTVTVYDYQGKKIKSWTGKFDVSSSEDEVYFDDDNGKRVIIHGGIVVNEEN